MIKKVSIFISFVLIGVLGLAAFAVDWEDRGTETFEFRMCEERYFELNKGWFPIETYKELAILRGKIAEIELSAKKIEILQQTWRFEDKDCNHPRSCLVLKIIYRKIQK